MEPPAKRMRILQSLGVDEVDESNPDYIKGKQQNSEWLKNKWDAIYAKYGAMPDMMSDEVDMRGDGALVVDRGHMRRLDKDYRNRLARRRRAVMPEDDTLLVDDMFANDQGMEPDDGDEDEGNERDELAPSQSPEPVPFQSDALPDESVARRHVSSIAPSTGQANIPVPNTPMDAALRASFAVSANPPADLSHLVQFPQTPAGQQARRAFEAHTAQAVQQAVASIFSSLLSNAPTLQSPQPSLAQAHETPALDVGPAAPVTVPNPRRSPLPVLSDPPVTSRSSPISVPQAERRRRAFAIGVHINSRRHDRNRRDVPLMLESDVTPTSAEHMSGASDANDKSDVHRPIIQLPSEHRKRTQQARNPKHVFTEDEDQYIIESRLLHKRTWNQIISSRPHWKDWSKSTFWARWSGKLREQAAEIERSSELAARRSHEDVEKRSKDETCMVRQSQSPPPAAPHLPTPNSLMHENTEESNGSHNLGNSENTLLSGGHLDDDEKDLLSLYGDGGMVGSDDTDEDVDRAREIPETPLELTQEDSDQPILQGTLTREPTVDASAKLLPKATSARKHRSAASSLPVKTKHNVNVSPPKQMDPGTLSTSSTKGRPLKHMEPATSSDATFAIIASSSEKDLESPSSPLSSYQHHQCLRCKQTFSTSTLLDAHVTQPHPVEIHVHVSASESSPLPIAQYSHVPSTPAVAIKREPTEDGDVEPEMEILVDGEINAPSNFSLASTPPQSAKTPTSSVGKLPRSTYAAVKRSWARAGRTAKGTTTPRKNRSHGSSEKVAAALGVSQKRKRFWDEGASEDELAM